jgi:hypothetical protein
MFVDGTGTEGKKKAANQAAFRCLVHAVHATVMTHRVHPMLPSHSRVTLFPVSTLVASGVGIARSVVLAVGIRVKLRAVARVRNYPLSRRRRSKRCDSYERGADRYKLHSGFLRR